MRVSIPFVTKLSMALLCCALSSMVHSQTVGSRLPRIDASGEYLFYLHGGVVTNKGDGAINDSAPEWGPYEYTNILDSLKKHGFFVISERRMPQIDDSVYVLKIVRQIDTLLASGVSARNILVVGASAGGHIAFEVASRLRNGNLKFAVLGACWPSTHKEYEKRELRGNFLSIVEKSDPHGTCSAIFQNRKHITFKEIFLDTNLSHGFLYKGHKQWIDPIIAWARMD